MLKKLKVNERIFCPATGNISEAWVSMFHRLIISPRGEVGSCVIVIDDFDSAGLPNENKKIRSELDLVLMSLTHRDCEDVASTIFPFSLWNKEMNDGGEHVFLRYKRIWPRLKKRYSHNARGNYFQRLIDFEGNGADNGTNQLKTIIENYKKTRRRSALQATVFDPRRDLAPTPMQGFPCLQQVAFSPSKQGLIVTGYYVLQYMFERGYGNYLGLCRLGAFMAQQMGMPLSKVVIMLSFAKLTDKQKKRELNLLDEKLANIL